VPLRILAVGDSVTKGSVDLTFEVVFDQYVKPNIDTERQPTGTMDIVCHFGSI
jgi:hypothetical protein